MVYESIVRRKSCNIWYKSQELLKGALRLNYRLSKFFFKLSAAPLASNGSESEGKSFLIYFTNHEA